MKEIQLAVYDDGRGSWGPMSDCRPVFCLRSGSRTTFRRIEQALARPVDVVFAPDRFEKLLRSRHDRLVVNPQLSDELLLCVNGRWQALDEIPLVKNIEPGSAIVQQDDQVIAALVNGRQVKQLIEAGSGSTDLSLKTIRIDRNILIERPWHILNRLTDALASDLNASEIPELDPRSLSGVVVEGGCSLHAAADVKIWPTVVVDVSGGSVVIDEAASIYPYTYLQGPCYIGRQSVICSHTAIRANTVIGPVCKIGGEVSGTIVHGYTNKAHAGYLGDSLIGAWCNFGADTTVSNLKNTYGHVRTQLESTSEPEQTGRMFHGAVVGDFVRTSIGSRIPTGAVLGTGCMLACAGFAPKYTPAFLFHTESTCRHYDFDKFIHTARTMMTRRNMNLSDAEIDLLRDLHGTIRSTG